MLPSSTATLTFDHFSMPISSFFIGPSISLLTASRTETNDLKELLDVSREYVTAIRVKQAITDAGEDVARSLELSAYFTHCNLQVM